MLKDSRGVTHPLEVRKAEGWKRLDFPEHGSPRRKAAPTRLVSLACLLKDLRVTGGHLGPHHSPAHHVGLFPHRMAAGFVREKVQHTGGNGIRIPERHQHAAIVRKKLGCMPVGRRNHRLAGTETISQRARGDLRLVEIRGQIDVGGTYEFAEFRIFHIPVHEHHIPLHSEIASELLERLAVALTIAADQIRMGGAEDDINDIRMLAGNLR